MSRPLSLRRSPDRLRILPDDQIRNTKKLKDAIVDALADIADRNPALADRLTEQVLTAWPGFSRA